MILILLCAAMTTAMLIATAIALHHEAIIEQQTSRIQF
jgi:hypothetical protein